MPSNAEIPDATEAFPGYPVLARFSAPPDVCDYPRLSGSQFAVLQIEPKEGFAPDVMIVGWSEYRKEWLCNWGERAVIRCLLDAAKLASQRIAELEAALKAEQQRIRTIIFKTPMLPIEAPDEQSQRRIAAFLCRLDELITEPRS